jgi:hypothetical protein
MLPKHAIRATVLSAGRNPITYAKKPIDRRARPEKSSSALQGVARFRGKRSNAAKLRTVLHGRAALSLWSLAPVTPASGHTVSARGNANSGLSGAAG